MQLKHVFSSILLIVFIFLSIFFLNGVFYSPPQGLNLSISENISPNVKVFVLDQFGKTVTSIETNDDFFPQQEGLEEGTVYGFRVIDEKGGVSMPVYETFIANSPDWTGWEIGGRYYNGLKPGNYTIELLVIEDSAGTVTAKTNLSSFSLYEQRAGIEKKVMDDCGHLMTEPLVDIDGWSRDGKIARCAAKIGVEQENIYACDTLFKLFNNTNFDECVTEYAITEGNASICDYTGMPKSRGFCKAKVTKDWTECRKISCDISCMMASLETQQDLCIQWYAIENRNASLCSEIESQAYNMKEICLNLTTGS